MRSQGLLVDFFALCVIKLIRIQFIIVELLRHQAEVNIKHQEICSRLLSYSNLKS